MGSVGSVPQISWLTFSSSLTRLAKENDLVPREPPEIQGSGDGDRSGKGVAQAGLISDSVEVIVVVTEESCRCVRLVVVRLFDFADDSVLAV